MGWKYHELSDWSKSIMRTIWFRLFKKYWRKSCKVWKLLTFFSFDFLKATWTRSLISKRWKSPWVQPTYVWKRHLSTLPHLYSWYISSVTLWIKCILDQVYFQTTPAVYYWDLDKNTPCGKFPPWQSTITIYLGCTPSYFISPTYFRLNLHL